MLISGVIGATLTGMILDKTPAFKRLISICIVVFIITLCFFGLVLLGEYSHTLQFMLTVPFGFTLCAIMPAGLGLGVELTFPKI